LQLFAIVVTLCLQGACVDKTVTDQATQLQCGVTAMQRIPEWMAEQGYLQRGYRLAKWGCERADRRKTPA